MVSAGDTSYGMNNDSSSSSSSDSGIEPSNKHFDPNTKGTIDTGQMIPAMPTIPGVPASGGGDVSVDTRVLKQFADNLDTIADAVKQAWQKNDGIQAIKPGLFTEAKDLQSKISGGESGGGGLQQSLGLSLDSLQRTLMDTANGIRTMANKYSTMEELNAKAGGELRGLMQTASTDLQAFQQQASAAGQSLQSDISSGGVSSGSSDSGSSDSSSTES